MIERNEKILLDSLKDAFIRQKGKEDDECFGPSDINEDKREYYVKNPEENCFQGKISNKFKSDGRAIRSSAAMIYNTLGDVNAEVVFSSHESYIVTDYEEILPGLKGRTGPHLDVVLKTKDEDKVIFIESKCLEWLSTSENMSNSYLESKNYKYENSDIFIPWFKKFIEFSEEEKNEYASIYKRYNSKQMNIHIFGIYNWCKECRENEKKLPKEINLWNIVWNYSPIEEYQTEETEGKEYCKKATEYFHDFFDKEFGIIFKVEYVRYSDFLNRVDWTDSQERRNYLRRYEIPRCERRTYSNEEFIRDYEKLYKETWHRNESQEDYEKRIKEMHIDLSKDAFDKKESQKNYNPRENEKAYTREELENLINDENFHEVWKFLSNPGYTRYAVSSLGRVAFKTKNEYEVIKQDDTNHPGYLKLDPDYVHLVDHNIEVYKLIAMGFLGKTISDGYDVHHRINDGLNCRPENLILLTRAQHNAVHSSKQLEPEELKEYLNKE